MSKTWEPTRKGIRDLNRHVRKGTVVYTVREQADWAVWNDSRYYNEHVFDWRSPVTGHWMTGHLSAEGLLLQEGKVYEQPPRGVRNITDSDQQVAGPLGHGDYTGYLDDAEISGLEKRVKNGSDPYTRAEKGGAAKPKPRHGWF